MSQHNPDEGHIDPVEECPICTPKIRRKRFLTDHRYNEEVEQHFDKLLRAIEGQFGLKIHGAVVLVMSSDGTNKRPLLLCDIEDEVFVKSNLEDLNEFFGSFIKENAPNE